LNNPKTEKDPTQAVKQNLNPIDLIRYLMCSKVKFQTKILPKEGIENIRRIPQKNQS